MTKKIGILSVVLLLGITIGVGNHKVVGEEQKELVEQDDLRETDFVEIDYTNIDSVVNKILKEVPKVSLEVETIRKGSNEKTMKHSEESILNVEKTKFRFKVESELTNQKNYEDVEITAEAETFTKNYLRALSIAEDYYGVSVSQEEVTKYIDEYISVVITEEKEKYAKALGLTLYELDYIFDRDFYVMDTLWDKLIPVLMEKYPQEKGEDQNIYFERIKEEFYSKK